MRAEVDVLKLTLRGVSRPLSLPFTLNRVAATIYGLHTVAGFSATAMLDRRDFGITAFGHSIGDQVNVWLVTAEGRFYTRWHIGILSERQEGNCWPEFYLQSVWGIQCVCWLWKTIVLWACF